MPQSEFETESILTEPGADAKERHDAFHFEPTWKGLPLQAYSIKRQILWIAAAHAAGYPKLDDCRERGTVHLFVPAAALLVFILTKNREQLDAIRFPITNLILEAEKWQDETLTRDDFPGLIDLTLKILQVAREGEAEPLPSEFAGGSEKN